MRIFRINLVIGKADALLKRLQSEGRNSPADVLLTTDAGRLHRAKRAGVTRSIDSAALRSAIPESYRDPDGHWYGLSLRARPILYVETNGEYPVRGDIPGSPVLAAWGTFKTDDLNLAQLGELNDDAVRLMDRAGWK